MPVSQKLVYASDSLPAIDAPHPEVYMPKTIQCPDCQRKLQIADELTGRRLRCPACKTTFVAGQAEAAVPVMAFKVAAPVPLPASPRTRPSRPSVDLEDEERALDRPRRQIGDDIPPRWRSPVRGRKKNGSHVIVLLVVGIVAAVGVAVVMLGSAVYLLVHFNSSKKAVASNRPIPIEDKQQRDKEVKEAFQNRDFQAPPAKNPIPKKQPKAAPNLNQELNSFFSSFSQAIVQRNAELVHSHFDMERLFDEMVAQQTLPPQLANDKKGFLAGTKAGMSGAMSRNQNLRWNSTEIKHVKSLSPDEVVVIARHHVDTGASLKMRWWLTRRSGSWRLYDFEDLDVGLRGSTLMCALAGGLENGQVNNLVFAVQQVTGALQALGAARDVDLADQKLKSIAHIKLPAALDALRWLGSAVICISRGQNEQALEALDKSQALQPDMPAVDLLKGIIYNNMAQWENALKHIQKYRDLLGDDPLVRQEFDKATRGLAG
jgi:tetratricopeptide (TPR) repeat protein